MGEVENFLLDDIDGCEFVHSKKVGKLLISKATDENDCENGNLLVVYSDGSQTEISFTTGQKKLDNGEWKVYRYY